MDVSFTIIASAARRRSSVKDGAKKENERLCNELDTLHREQKKLKQVVEQLATDYEESKQYDPLRRYKRMKGIVKRTVMHFRLNPDQPDSAEGLGTGGLVQNYRTHSYQLESARRREEKYSSKLKCLLNSCLTFSEMGLLRKKCKNVD